MHKQTCLGNHDKPVFALMVWAFSRNAMVVVGSGHKLQNHAGFPRKRKRFKEMKRDNHRASMICDNYAFPVFLPSAFFFFPLSPDFVSLKNPFVLFLCETLFEITCQKMAFPEAIFRFLRRFMYSRILLEGKTCL